MGVIFALFQSDHSGQVVVQHLAEASPPALGISARRQSVEFQKLIGSGINMVGSGYIFLGIIQQHKRQDWSKEQLPFIWRLAGVVQMSSKIGISPALSTLYLMFMIPSYSPILHLSLYFHLTQVWSLPGLVTHWLYDLLLISWNCLIKLPNQKLLMCLLVFWKLLVIAEWQLTAWQQFDVIIFTFWRLIGFASHSLESA